MVRLVGAVGLKHHSKLLSVFNHSNRITNVVNLSYYGFRGIQPIVSKVRPALIPNYRSTLQRSFSSIPIQVTESNANTSQTIVGQSNEVVNSTLLVDSQPLVGSSSTGELVEAVLDATSAIPELGNAPTHIVMRCIEHVHLFADVPYWQAIVITTIALRLVLLPLAIKTVQNASRMTILRPHMLRIQETFQKDPNYEDMRVKMKYQKEMQELFVQYKVNPLRSLLLPIVQLPIFIFFFLGLKDIGNFLPGIATGGILWFTDLSGPDTYLIFPMLNALSFLFMVEMGADGMQTSQQETFKWVMRGLAVAMAPLTMAIPQVR